MTRKKEKKNGLALAILLSVIAMTGCNTKPIGLQMPKNINEKDNSSETYLMKISRNKDINKLKEAIAKGADVKIRNNYNLDAIIYAAMNEHPESVKLIYANGVDKDKIDISYILEWGTHNSVEQLIDLGCNPNYKGYTGVAPLYKAVFSDNKNIFPKLIKAGADVNIINKDGSTILHATIQAKNDKYTQMLLSKNCNVNAANKDGVVPLHLAAKNQDYKLMQQLINKGADINAKDGNDATTVFIASLMSDVKMMKLLIKNKADLKIKSKWGTPLDFSENKKDVEMIKLIKSNL